MRHPQTPSRMPFGKYVPFHEQIPIDLPDRTWPTNRLTKAPRWAAVDPVSYTHLTLPTSDLV